MMKQHTQQRETALLVIDVQKGLFEKTTPIYRAKQVLENINTLINKARQENVPVVFIQHSNNKYAKSSKFLSPPQADGVLRNFAPSGTDFAKAQNPRSKLRGIL
jgi:nicotinamidase-related amidase